MKKRIPLLAVILLTFSLLNGCLSQKVKDITYYVLEYPRGKELSVKKPEEPYPGTVFVEDAEVGDVYDRKELVWREEGPIIGYFDFHHWGIRLPKMVSDYVARGMEESGLFSTVYRAYTLEEADNILTPVIKRAEMVKAGESGQPGIRFEIEFLWQKQDSLVPVFVHTREFEEDIADEEPVTFVMAVNDLLFRGIEEFLVKFQVWRGRSGGSAE